MSQALQKILILMALFIVYSSVSHAADRERATYVGGGRYVGEAESVKDALLRQRSDEYSERQVDRQRNEDRYERAERRERWDRDDRDSSVGY
jgi:hypothetical protein